MPGSRGFKRVLKLLLFVYLLYAALLVVLQRRILFVGTERPAPVTSAPPSGAEVLWLETEHGRVESWFLPARDAARPGPTLLFAHGNYELIDDWAEPFAAFTGRGFSVLLVEYPGYGRSTGEPSEASVRAAFAAAFEALAKRPEVDPKRIVAYGRSLGGGAVCTLLPKHAPAALILQSTFSSLAPFAHARGVPWFLLRDRFDSAAALQRYAGPTLIVHGTHDELIPHAHAERLLKAARNGKLIDYAAGHNDCPPDWERFVDEVDRFVRAP